MKRNFLLIGLLLLLSFCSQSDQQREILAKVGNRQIIVDEFLNRLYFSPRPAYCSGTSQKDKEIVISNFIAEKALAIVAEKNLDLTRRPRLLNFLQGIKEQTMRQVQFEKEALNKVEIDSNQLNEILQNAARTYQVEAISALSQNLNKNLILLNKENLDSVDFENLKQLAKAVEKLKLSFYTSQHPLIFEKLYLKPAKVGQIIGPIWLDSDQVLILRINSWRSVKNFSEIERHFFKKLIEEQLRMREATKFYFNFIRKVMGDKQLQFHLSSLRNLVNLLGPVYFEPGAPDFISSNLNDPLQLWKREVRLDSMKNRNFRMLNERVLSIDGRHWTIAEILKEMEHHPLVFREKKYPRRQFGNQLKLALIDLVRDQYLTKEAYKKGYDENRLVKQTVNLWRDYFYSVLEKEQLLRENGINPANSWPLLPDSLITSLISKLQVKIHVNKRLLQSIKLPEIQTIAIQKNTPYPMAIPNFPLITSKALPFLNQPNQ